MTGSAERGTPKIARSSSSQSKVSRFINNVRLALVTSVACTPARTPPERFHNSHESMVPNRALALFAAGTLFRNQFILLPAKYGAIVKPVVWRIFSC